MKKSLQSLTLILTLAAAASGMAGAIRLGSVPTTPGVTTTCNSPVPTPSATIMPMDDCPRCL